VNAATWLPLTVLAYAMFAVTGVIDKIVVSKKITNPLVISFWVSFFGIWSAIILLIGWLPVPFASAFRFHMPTGGALGLIAVAGITLQLALMVSYTALKWGEATRVVSAIGASTPVFALVFAFALLGERLGPLSYLAFGLLLAGAVTMLARRGRWLSWSLGLALLSAALSALETVLVKLVYAHNDFISSFALLGSGNLLYCGALLLLSPSVRAAVRASLVRKPGRRPKKRRAKPKVAGQVLILFNTIFGGLGVIVLNLALKLGSASLVNAMRGLQYVGIFLIALLLGRVYPKLLREEMTAQSMRQKVLGIVIIGIGLALLTVAAL
jgi:uncharacterized membrane protein